MAHRLTDEREKRGSEGATRKTIDLGGGSAFATEAGEASETRTVPHKGMRGASRARENRGGGDGRGKGTAKLVDRRPERKEFGRRLEVGGDAAKGSKIGVFLGGGSGRGGSGSLGVLINKIITNDELGKVRVSDSGGILMGLDPLSLRDHNPIGKHGA